MHLPVLISHIRMSLSSEADARTFESGLQAIVLTPARCPSKVWANAPVFESQILIVQSAAISG